MPGESWSEREARALVDAFEEEGLVDPPMAEALREYVDRGELNRAFALIDGVTAGDADERRPARTDARQ